MNYLAHGWRLLHRPWALAGTALPDWLRVIDKRARMHAWMLPQLQITAPHEAELIAGVAAHHGDDLTFHTHTAFEAISHELTKQIRTRFPADPRLRASAFGHIVAEMLLDAALLDVEPTLGARYYDALSTIDVHLVADLARRATGRPLAQLPLLIERFVSSRFLLAYQTDEGLLDCVHGLCARAGLPPPPDGFLQIITDTRPSVRAVLPELSALFLEVNGR